MRGRWTHGDSVIPVAHRRRLLVAAFVVGSAAVGVCLVGLYQPSFELAGRIKE